MSTKRKFDEIDPETGFLSGYLEPGYLQRTHGSKRKLDGDECVGQAFKKRKLWIENDQDIDKPPP